MSLIKQKDIELAKTNLDYLEATVLQMQKDVQLHGIYFEIDKTRLSSYETVLNEVNLICEQLLRQDAGKFFSILYSIDIGEQKVRNLLGENQSKSGIGELILERELLKVLTKKHYADRMK